MPHIDFTGPDGSKWPSATELTALLPKDWLWAWYKREVQKHGWRGWQKCNATSNRGKRMGSHLHALVEMGLTGRKYIPYLDYAKKIIEPGRRLVWLERMANEVLTQLHSVEVEKVEAHLISAKDRLHGTADYIVRDNTIGLTVDDLKTTGAISPDMPIQLAIYARLWNENNPTQLINYGRIRRADKKSPKFNIQVKDFDSLHYYYPVIDALRVIWDYVNKQGSWEK